MEWFESIALEQPPRPLRRWSIWDKLIVAMLATTLAAALGFFFVPLARQRAAMQSQLRRLERELEWQESRRRQLSREIIALQSDRDYIGRLAREKLNLVAPGEVIFQFGTATPAVSPPFPAPRR
jgi:cell division protein FtsB